MTVSSRLVALVIGLTLGLAIGVFVKRHVKQRRANELTQHPERLEEMLDPTDDA